MNARCFAKIDKNFLQAAIWGAVVIFLLLVSQSLAAAPESTPEQENRADLQKTITLLEDDEKRAEVIKILRLLSELNVEEQTAAHAADENASPAEPATQSGLKAYVRNQASSLIKNLSVADIAFKQALTEFLKIMKTLAAPEVVELWRPYVLEISSWGLGCLLAIFLLTRKFGRITSFEPTLGGRAKAVLKYCLLMGGPNLVLIAALLVLPNLSPTAKGVTADMAIGFSFIHSVVLHFFINMSGLYIYLRMIAALFRRNDQGNAIIDIHPVLARHFLHSSKVFAIYFACLVFVKIILLEHFAMGILYSLTIVVLTLPLPVYLTFRILKLQQLVFIVQEAEATADVDEPALSPPDETNIQRKPNLDFRADIFLKRHWAAIANIGIWTLASISLLNPRDASDRFVSRLAITLAIIVLATLTIKAARLAMARFIAYDTEHGRRFLLNIDSLANVTVWLIASILTLLTWGLPLGELIYNDIVRDIAGRGLTIIIILTALVVFMRFSRVATEWILSVPDLGRNRNWRTVAPLISTAMRALAVFTTIVVILERLGVNVGPILAGAGILGLGVGMGAQSLVKDVINGLSILLTDTLSVGDYVTIAGQSGTVENVGLRNIRLRDASGNLIVVPNSSIDSIVNMTRDYSQDVVEFTVPCDADPDEMLNMAAEVAQEISNDPDWRIYMTTPVAVIGIVNFNEAGTTIRLKNFTTAGNQWMVSRELRLRLKRRMLQMNIKSTQFGRSVFLINREHETAANQAAMLASTKKG